MAVVIYVLMILRPRAHRLQFSRLLRWRVLRKLSLIGASAYGTNPLNFESAWKALYQSVAWEVLLGRTKASGVFTEVDIFLDTANLSADETSHLDSLAIRACRPDVAIGYYAVRLSRDRKSFKVLHLNLAVLIEIKRSPSRDLVALDDGLPYGKAGETELNRLAVKAQLQVSGQGALYLRTPAGMRQNTVLLVAVAGRSVSYTIMTRTNDVMLIDTWKLVSDCAELQVQEEEEGLMLTQQKEKRPKRGATKSARPPPPKAWQFNWSDFLDGAGPEFRDVVRRYVDIFEREFRQKNPDSFCDLLMPRYVCCI